MLNEKQMLGKTDAEIKKYGVLKSAFQKIYDCETSLYKKRVDSFDMIKEIKETDNLLLNDIYTEFTSQMKDLEEKRKKQLAKIHDKILPATVFYPNKVKVYKQKIVNYVDIKKQNVKLDNERTKAQSNNEKDKSNALQSEQRQNENLLNENAKTIEKDILIFETERVVDNKYFFLHFIHSELAFHAESFEKLSKLYQRIVSIKPISQLKDFVKKYQLNSVGDLANYGYDEREFERRDRPINKNQSVYQNNNQPKKSVINNNIWDGDEEEINNNV